MKKYFLTSLLAAAVAFSAAAEGYQVNSLSARQIGMGHVGVAMKLGAESQFFNPAGMGFLDKQLDINASFTGIMSHCTATLPDGRSYNTDSDVATPIIVDAAFSIFKNFKAGVAFYTPYGSSINWTNNWPGAVLNQSVALKVYTIQPTFAYRPIPKLSIGAGLTISWGTVNLNKGLVPAETFNMLLAAQGHPGLGETTPASVNLKGTADVRVGVNLGVMYEVIKDLNVGLSWRSTTKMHVAAGDASVTYANELAQTALQQLNVLNTANFTAEMPAPWVLSFGASWKPISKLTVAADARLTGWSAYKTLDIEFLSEQLKPFDQHITKDYRNAWAVSLGAELALTKRFDLRAGLMIDTTPVNKGYYNPETPGMTKIEPTVGLSFRPIPRLSIDLGFMYVAGLGAKDTQCPYINFLTQKVDTFRADYKLHAFTPSIGLNFNL